MFQNNNMYQYNSLLPPTQEQTEDQVLSYITQSHLDSQFLHGTFGRINDKYSKHGQAYLSSRCAKNWDAICEIESRNAKNTYPNMLYGIDLITKSHNRGITSGEQLVRNTAFKRYKVEVKNCNLLCEPYDPSVPNSRLVCFESKIDAGDMNLRYGAVAGSVPAGSCKGVYSLEHIENVDSEPVLNKLITYPYICPDLLVMIHRDMTKRGTIGKLRGTRIGAFYETLGFKV